MLRKHSGKVEQVEEALQQMEPKAKEVHASLLAMHNACVSPFANPRACTKRATYVGRDLAYHMMPVVPSSKPLHNLSVRFPTAYYPNCIVVLEKSPRYVMHHYQEMAEVTVDEVEEPWAAKPPDIRAAPAT